MLLRLMTFVVLEWTVNLPYSLPVDVSFSRSCPSQRAEGESEPSATRTSSHGCASRILYVVHENQVRAQGKKFGCQTAHGCHLHFVVQADPCRTKLQQGTLNVVLEWHITIWTYKTRMGQSLMQPVQHWRCQQPGSRKLPLI